MELITAVNANNLKRVNLLLEPRGPLPQFDILRTDSVFDLSSLSGFGGDK